MSTTGVNENLVELCYSKFADHYGKSCWVSSYPTWSNLNETDKKFWKDLVMGSRTGFKRDLTLAQKDEKTTQFNPSLDPAV